MGGLRLALLGLCLAVAGGCVSSGKHREVSGERDRLREQNAQLEERVKLVEASNESLSAERVKLIGEVEDLRDEQGELYRSVEELRTLKAGLEENLARSESELAARQAEVRELRATYDGLVQDLQSEVAAGRVEIEQLREGLRVKLAQAILFPLGSAELSPGGAEVIGKVAGRLAGLEHRIEVEGHSDNLPIGGALAARFPSNWELAGARAGGVVRLLVAGGVPGERLAAVSYGETRPVASNDTPEGRARNRRIEIRLVPMTAGPGASAE